MLPNLNAAQVIENLSLLIPQNARLLLTADADLKSRRLWLRAVKCLKSFSSSGKEWIAGTVYQAWFSSYANDYYIVFPGKEEVYITGKHYWQPLEQAQIINEVAIDRQLNILKVQTETYRLIANSDGFVQLIPAWWLDAEKVIGCYYLKGQLVKYCLQLVEYQRKQMLSWRFVSTIPTAQVQWFILEQGKFIEVSEANPLHKIADGKEGNYQGYSFNVKDGILKFII